jgi:hypothetical protein
LLYLQNRFGLHISNSSYSHKVPNGKCTIKNGLSCNRRYTKETIVQIEVDRIDDTETAKLFKKKWRKYLIIILIISSKMGE